MRKTLLRVADLAANKGNTPDAYPSFMIQKIYHGDYLFCQRKTKAGKSCDIFV